MPALCGDGTTGAMVRPSRIPSAIRTGTGTWMPPNTGVVLTSSARADEQQPELRDRGGVDHRTNSGSRWSRCVANPQVIRSIHGNVSAKVTKIASARGMNPSTLSWIDVTVWNMLTSDAGDKAGEEHRQADHERELDGLTDDADDKGFRHGPRASHESS